MSLTSQNNTNHHTSGQPLSNAFSDAPLEAVLITHLSGGKDGKAFTHSVARLHDYIVIYAHEATLPETELL